MPIGLGAGFARAPTMAMEAIRKKLVCMMDAWILFGSVGGWDETLYVSVSRCSCLDCRVDVLAVYFIIECEFLKNELGSTALLYP